jgi:hypothetical protein
LWRSLGLPLLADGEVMELQEFYERMERHRANAIDHAVQKYRSLPPLLGKVMMQACMECIGESS